MVAAATNDIRPDDLLEIETIARNTPSYVTLLTPSRSSPATETSYWTLDQTPPVTR